MGAVLNPLLFVFGFLRMGTGGLIAQAFGAEDGLEAVAGIVRSLSVAIILGLLLFVLEKPLAWGAFSIIHAPDAKVLMRAQTYFQARLAGAPAALGNFSIKAWLIGMQRPRQALIANLFLNISNALLCVLLSWFLDFGVAGVGFATAMANYISFVFGLLQILYVSREVPWVLQRQPGQSKLDWTLLFDKSRLPCLPG